MNRLAGERIFDVFILVVSVVFVSLAAGYSSAGRLAPLIVGIPTALLALYRIVRGLVRPREAPYAVPEKAFWLRLATMYMWVVGFLILSILAGFLISIPLFALGFLLIQNRTPIRVAVLLTLGIEVVVYLFFVRLVGVPFPTGLLF